MSLVWSRRTQGETPSASRAERHQCSTLTPSSFHTPPGFPSDSWAAIFHFLFAVFNISDYTRFITDMTSETFGFYVGIVYIQKGIELLGERRWSAGLGPLNTCRQLLEELQYRSSLDGHQSLTACFP